MHPRARARQIEQRARVRSARAAARARDRDRAASETDVVLIGVELPRWLPRQVYVARMTYSCSSARVMANQLEICRERLPTG